MPEAKFVDGVHDYDVVEVIGEPQLGFALVNTDPAAAGTVRIGIFWVAQCKRARAATVLTHFDREVNGRWNLSRLCEAGPVEIELRTCELWL